MIPGMNPAQMQKMMKQMGMQTTEIDATEVVIKTPDKDIVITNPQVSKIKVMGQETFQIAGGEISEEEAVEETLISEEDIKLVIEQTGATEEEVQQALEEANGDIAQAIMALKS